MRYWGKLLGLILGIMSGGSVWGVITGVLMGHMVDRLGLRVAVIIFPHSLPDSRYFFSPRFRL